MSAGDETLLNFEDGPTSLKDPMLGAVVDGYQVIALVGTGAMGVVYRAMHQVIGKPVAIKVLKPDFSDDPDMVDRLIREARSVNAIRHPGIIDIFGFGRLPSTNQPYIVMSLLEGEPLDVFISRRGPITFAEAAPMLDDLLAALGAAHGVGVIHRDLKPGNVFLEKQPEGRAKLKLLDFGLARQADRAHGSIRPTNPGTLLGTPAFMAPEQVLGEKVTPSTDLYAVGGIAYQLLTGHLPHEAPSAIEVITQKMKFDPIRPRQWKPEVSEEVDAWIMALLERDGDTRQASADAARAALKKLMAKTQRPSASGPKPSLHRKGTGEGPRRHSQDAKTTVAAESSRSLQPVETKVFAEAQPARTGTGVVPKREWKDAPTQVADAATGRFEAPVATPEHDAAVEPTVDLDSPFAGQAKTTPEMASPFGGQEAPDAKSSAPRPWEVRPSSVQAAHIVMAPEVGESTLRGPPKKSMAPLFVVLAVLGAALAGGVYLLFR